MKIFGTPTINPIVFYTGKLAFVGNLVFVFLRSYVDVFNFNPLIIIANLLLLAIPGTLILFISIFQMGESIRVGLPEEETTLKTHGLFKFSRNPIYVSVIMLGVASCIYVPHWLNIIFLVLAVIIHHQIIKEEERFLLGKFKEQWVDYSKRVRRYL